MVRALSVVTAAVAIAFSRSSSADTWPAPSPVSFHSRGFFYVAEVFPPNSRQNDRDTPICYFYKMGYPGRAWKIDARLIWKAQLPHHLAPCRMPHEALVSMDGVLVTLNDYGRPGGDNAVVIYDRKGNVVRSYHLDELIPKGDMKSRRWWNNDAKYCFLRGSSRLYVVLRWGKALEFMLKDGAFRYAPAEAFPDLQPLIGQPHADERAHVYATSLRFSSITDVLEARTGRPVQVATEPITATLIVLVLLLLGFLAYKTARRRRRS